MEYIALVRTSQEGEDTAIANKQEIFGTGMKLVSFQYIVSEIQQQISAN